jgi:hypothetical protein
MADTFIMRWPGLGKEVRCDKLSHNQHIFDWFEGQLPLKAVQGHTMVSGWCLYTLSIPLKEEMTWEPGTEAVEDLTEEADGRINVMHPVGGAMEMLTKYAEATEYLDFISFAQVVEEDLPTLREVGAAQWEAVINTKDIIVVEFVKEGR